MNFHEILDEYIVEIHNLQSFLITNYKKSGNPTTLEISTTVTETLNSLEKLELQLLEKENLKRENQNAYELRKAQKRLKTVQSKLEKLGKNYEALLGKIKVDGCTRCGAPTDYLEKSTWKQGKQSWVGLHCSVCNSYTNAVEGVSTGRYER